MGLGVITHTFGVPANQIAGVEVVEVIGDIIELATRVTAG